MSARAILLKSKQQYQWRPSMVHTTMSSVSLRSIAFPIAATAFLLCSVPHLSAATLCVNPGGTAGCKSTINAAVSAASPGDTIRVAPGTYKEDVVIAKSLSLVAWDHRKPVIDATGLSNGIFINGMSAAPASGVSNVLISGVEIENANFEGILVANASDVTLLRNHVHDNDRALDISAHTCNGIPAFETNEGDDCGEGIHLMGADHATVVRNDVGYNAGGILTSDETGPSHNNLISENNVHDNQYDCGITFASHAPATSVIPSATLSYGVFDNSISENISNHNGYQAPGAGAGVGIFAPFPGTRASGNLVIHNVLTNNGQPGVTMHNHAWFPMAPPVNLNDNVIVGNYISGNAADGGDAATPGTTGINLYSVGPVWGTMVAENVIDDEAIDIAFKAPSGQINAHLNNFTNKSIGVDNLGAGSIDATENWWKCSKGPDAHGCATVSGPNVQYTPWLTSPYELQGNRDDDGHHDRD
jgi:nitrous oxidase accessory protein NosD